MNKEGWTLVFELNIEMGEPGEFGESSLRVRR